MTLITLAHRVRITARCEHDAKRRSRIPICFHLREPTIQRRFTQHREIGTQSRQDGLSFRIAEATVEFEHVGRAVRRDHDACVQEADVRRAVGDQTFRGRPHHFAHDALVHLLGDHGGR